MIGYLNATLEGLSTVRASENQSIFVNEFDKHQNHYTSTNFMMVCTSRAFGLWLDLIASCYVTYVVLRFVLFSEGIFFSFCIIAGDNFFPSSGKCYYSDNIAAFARYGVVNINEIFLETRK